MAKAKISQLNPKGSNLSSTDLFEVSVQTGSGYDTFSITGQQIVGGVSSGFVPYTGATQDVDLGANKLSAESIYIEGTNGNGHLHLKHQNSDATATGQSTALWANSDGDIKWKNDNDYKTTLKTSLNTADRVYTFPDADCTLVPNGAITISGLTMATSRLLGRTTALNGAVEEISIGTGLTLSGGTLSSTGVGLTIGTTAITSGTVGRILFEGTGNVLQEDSALFWDNTNKRLGVGATPSTSVRLDVRAQGALSTDIAFRVRNSANSISLLEFQGTGNLITRHNSSGSSLGLFHRNDTTGFSLTTGTSGYGTGTGIEVVGSTWILASGSRQFAFTTNAGTDGDLWTFQNNGTAAGKRMSLSKSGNETFCWSGENYSIGGNIWGNPPTETNSFGIKNGTAPTTNATDAFKLYSADIVAGNAAPHFRTENGNIIKLYRETTAVAGATLVSGLGTPLTDTDTFDGYTLKQIVKALRNQGLLA